MVLWPKCCANARVASGADLSAADDDEGAQDDHGVADGTNEKQMGDAIRAGCYCTIVVGVALLQRAGGGRQCAACDALFDRSFDGVPPPRISTEEAAPRA